VRYVLLFVLLSGCASVDSIADRGAAVSDEALQSAEFIMCRAITVGTWVRTYGNDPQKADAWRKLCTATPIAEMPK
jgi:hypothetical protein